jgi:hypothetical protein
LDHAERIELLPDITWWADGKCRAVIDAPLRRVGVRITVHGPDLNVPIDGLRGQIDRLAESIVTPPAAAVEG